MKSPRLPCASALAAALTSVVIAGCSATPPVDTSRPGVAGDPSDSASNVTPPRDPATPPQPDDKSTPVSGRQSVPASSAQRIELSTTVCGGISSSCDNASLRVVDLAAATFELHRCVEQQADDAGLDSGRPAASGPSRFGAMRGDAVTVHALSPTQVQMVRDALAAVRYEKAKKKYEDGPMTTLVVVTPQGQLVLTPSEACGADDYDRIVDGLDGLTGALDRL
jgi:hypothetical protein